MTSLHHHLLLKHNVSIVLGKGISISLEKFPPPGVGWEIWKIYTLVFNMSQNGGKYISFPSGVSTE